MKIAIIGHGNVGGALAVNFANAGHQVTIGVRMPSDEAAAALRQQNASIGTDGILQAVQASEVVLVATPPEAANSLIEAFGDVKGKIIIDATNAIRTKPAGYSTAFHAFEALTKAHVVKCFNTTGYENMANPQYGSHRLDMFMAGNDEKAKEVAARLAADCGFESCLNFGGSDKVELLEQFALSWINLAIMQGHGRNIAFKLLRR